jgi:hypothetical protein
MTDDVLIYADTERSATMRHEIPLAIGDPFLYVEAGGRRVVLTNSLERDRLARAVPDVELVLMEEVGLDELIAAGMPRHEISLELCARLCARLGLRTAAVPPELPVALADRLRDDGVQLRPDHDGFEARRRAKTAAELAGIRRAQAAAEAGMAAGAALLREAGVAGDELRRDGGPAAGRDRARGDPRRVRRARRELPAGHHRRAQRPLPGRPRPRPRSARARRPDHRRPLAARRGVRLLRRHDADLRRRRAEPGDGRDARARDGGPAP